VKLQAPFSAKFIMFLCSHWYDGFLDFHSALLKSGGGLHAAVHKELGKSVKLSKACDKFNSLL
jgi:hypothetical protein